MARIQRDSFMVHTYSYKDWHQKRRHGTALMIDINRWSKTDRNTHDKDTAQNTIIK